MANTGSFFDNLYTVGKAKADIQKIMNKLYRGDFATLRDLQNELVVVAEKAKKSNKIKNADMEDILVTIAACKEAFEQRMESLNDKLAAAVEIMNSANDLYSEFAEKQAELDALNARLGI